MIGQRLAITATIAMLGASGCDSGTRPSEVLYTRAPATYLLSIDEMQGANFTVAQDAHSVGADWLAHAATAVIRGYGFKTGAEVLFSRPVGTLSISNGPIDVRDSVIAFDGADGAQRALAAETEALDARSGAEAVSTGPLGDSSHATTELAKLHSVEVVQITVVWRSANLVSSVVLHGRYGGARLDDALTLAHRQTENILNGGPPLPTAPAKPSPSPSPAPSPSSTARAAAGPP